MLVTDRLHNVYQHVGGSSLLPLTRLATFSEFSSQIVLRTLWTYITNSKGTQFLQMQAVDAYMKI